MHQGNFSVQETSVSLQIKCVMDSETAPLEWMRLYVQVKVQTTVMSVNFILHALMFIDCLCVAVTCAPGQFACSDGTCVATTALCDGMPDCIGGEDEIRTNCFTNTTTPTTPAGTDNADVKIQKHVYTVSLQRCVCGSSSL